MHAKIRKILIFLKNKSMINKSHMDNPIEVLLESLCLKDQTNVYCME